MTINIQEYFKPNTQTVGEVFSGHNYYQIPDFQRPYSWEDDNIEKLWDDIYSAFESDSPTPYFLGPVILAKETGKRYDVIDGQQRLTTLTILFCVLRDSCLNDLQEQEDKDHLKSLVSDAVKSMTESTYRMRLVTQEHYGNLFEQEILNGVEFPKDAFNKKEKRKPPYKFLNAALIFREKLKEIDIGKTQEFVQFLLNRVVVITITCSSTVSAIRLFQTINTSGLELTNADLIKSHLYSTIKEEEENEKKQFGASWQDIETITDQNEENVEDLLNYYGYFLLAKKLKKSLYEELTEEFKHNKRKANEVVHEFKTFAEHYDKVLNERTKAIHGLRNLPDRVFWKSILITARMVGFTHFNELSEELMRMYYQYWIAGYTTAKTRDLSIKIIDMLKHQKSFDEIKKEIDEKKAKDRVAERVMTNLQDDVYGNSWLKPLLVAVERTQKDDSVIIEYGRNLHVDHVLPQKWSNLNYWKQRWTPEKAQKWLDKIGNLTLLSGRKNIKASNDEFPKKKQIYDGMGHDGRTSFDITQRISKETDWKEEHVNNRQKWILAEIEKALGM